MAKRSTPADDKRRTVERVQTGVRMEKRILLVLKALAGAHDLTFGDLLEGIVLHAFEGKAPFGADSLAKVAALREVYGLDLTAADSHLLVEARRGRAGARASSSAR
jgi:predicted DNA-binding ribbon-helix-helix protein